MTPMTPFLIGSVGGAELLILIILIALLLFGSTKIPQLARGLGRALGEFKRGKMEIEREIAHEFSETPAPSQVEGAKNRIRDAAVALGLPAEGRSEADLKKAVANAAENTEDRTKVVAAAKALGIPVEGVGADELRREIARTVTF